MIGWTAAFGPPFSLDGNGGLLAKESWLSKIENVEPAYAGRESGAVAADDWSVIVASRPGGQGRTTLAQTLNLGLSLAGLVATLISIDKGEDVGGPPSKLAKLEKDVLDLRHGVSIEEQLCNPRAGASVFHPLLDAWLDRQNVVADTGPNAVDRIFEWARICRVTDVMDGRKVAFLVPTTGDRHALEEALTVLKLAEGGAIPLSKRAVAVVETAVGRKALSSPAKAALLAYCEANGVAVFEVPASPAVATLEAHRVGFIDAWTLTAAQYCERVAAAGFDDFSQAAAVGLRYEFGLWSGVVLKRMMAAGLLPEFAM